MSSCDLLLRVDRPLPSNSKIEMEVQLPAVGDEEPARVICHGKIVRVTDDNPDTVVAATIARYRFNRESQSSRRS